MASNFPGYKEFSIGSDGEGTGYYIGDDILITAGHNAYGVRASINPTNRSVTDLSGSTVNYGDSCNIPFLDQERGCRLAPSYSNRNTPSTTVTHFPLSQALSPSRRQPMWPPRALA